MTAETQRPITRYKIGYHTDEWGIRSSTPSGTPDPAGAWVRYEDHIAALVDARQPAAHVQNPAEIERVAGDVSKNGPESNMAQQPAPSAAAAVTREFLLNVVALCTYRGSSPEDIEDYARGDKWIADLWRQAELLLEAQPTPAPQADSQPAPQGETNAQLDTDSNPPTPGQQRDVAGPVALGQPVGNGSDQAAGHTGAQGDKLLTVAERNIRSFLRSAVFKSESDREAALNCVDVLWEAASAPADSVTAPAGGVVEDCRRCHGSGEDPEGYYDQSRGDGGETLDGPCRECDGTGIAQPTPPAQAADSVLEDAARWQEHVGKLDALVAYCPTCCQGFIAQKEMTRDDVLFACGKAVGQSGAKRLREALDLAVDHIDMDALRISHCKDAAVIDAARKQGANHD